MSDDDIRARADERRRMLGELELERKQLIRNIETCRIRDIDRAFIGDWSLKDIVGHVSSWEAQFTSSLRGARSGGTGMPPVLSAEEEDAWNAAEVERKRATPFWELMQQLHEGRVGLLEALGEFGDEELTEDGGVPAAILHQVVGHDRRHWHEIAAKLAGMAGVRGVSAEPNEAATSTSS